MRKCEDGSLHEGKLELITWNTPANPHESYGEDMGWGGVLAEEADEHKAEFEVSRSLHLTTGPVR